MVASWSLVAHHLNQFILAYEVIMLKLHSQSEGEEGESILVDNCIALFHVSGHSHYYNMHLFLIYIFLSFIFRLVFQGMGRGEGVTGDSELNTAAEKPKLKYEEYPIELNFLIF